MGANLNQQPDPAAQQNAGTLPAKEGKKGPGMIRRAAGRTWDGLKNLVKGQEKKKEQSPTELLAEQYKPRLGEMIEKLINDINNGREVAREIGNFIFKKESIDYVRFLTTPFEAAHYDDKGNAIDSVAVAHVKASKLEFCSKLEECIARGERKIRLEDSEGKQTKDKLDFLLIALGASEDGRKALFDYAERYASEYRADESKEQGKETSAVEEPGKILGEILYALSYCTTMTAKQGVKGGLWHEGALHIEHIYGTKLRKVDEACNEAELIEEVFSKIGTGYAQKFSEMVLSSAKESVGIQLENISLHDLEPLVVKEKIKNADGTEIAFPTKKEKHEALELYKKLKELESMATAKRDTLAKGDQLKKEEVQCLFIKWTTAITAITERGAAIKQKVLQETAGLQKMIYDKETEIKEKKAAAAASENELQGKEGEVQGLESRITTLKEEIKTKMEGITQWQSCLTDDMQKAKAEEQIKIREKKIVELKKAIRINEEKIEQLKPEIVQLREKISELNEEITINEWQHNELVEYEKRAQKLFLPLSYETSISNIGLLIEGISNKIEKTDTVNANKLHASLNEMEREIKELRKMLFPYMKSVEKADFEVSQKLQKHGLTVQDYRIALAILKKKILYSEIKEFEAHSEGRLTRFGKKDVLAWFKKKEGFKAWKEMMDWINATIHVEGYGWAKSLLKVGVGVVAIVPAVIWGVSKGASKLFKLCTVTIPELTKDKMGLKWIGKIAKWTAYAVANAITIAAIGLASWWIQPKAHHVIEKERQLVIDEKDGQVKWAIREWKGGWLVRDKNIDKTEKLSEMAYGVRYGIKKNENKEWLKAHPVVLKYFEKRSGANDAIILLSQWNPEKPQMPKGKENAFVLNRQKTDAFIGNLREKEKNGKIDESLLEQGEIDWVTNGYVVSKEVDKYMVKYGLNDTDARTIVNFTAKTSNVWLKPMLQRWADEWYVKDIKKLAEKIRNEDKGGKELTRESLVADAGIVEKSENLRAIFGVVPSEDNGEYLFNNLDKIELLKKYKKKYEILNLDGLIREIRIAGISKDRMAYLDPENKEKFNEEYLIGAGILKPLLLTSTNTAEVGTALEKMLGGLDDSQKTLVRAEVQRWIDSKQLQNRGVTCDPSGKCIVTNPNQFEVRVTNYMDNNSIRPKTENQKPAEAEKTPAAGGATGKTATGKPNVNPKKKKPKDTRTWLEKVRDAEGD